MKINILYTKQMLDHFVRHPVELQLFRLIGTGPQIKYNTLLHNHIYTMYSNVRYLFLKGIWIVGDPDDCSLDS